MPEETLQESLLGQRVKLVGYFDGAVTVEGVRVIGGGVELRVRLINGQLEEVVILNDALTARLLSP